MGLEDFFNRPKGLPKIVTGPTDPNSQFDELEFAKAANAARDNTTNDIRIAEANAKATADAQKREITTPISDKIGSGVFDQIGRGEFRGTKRNALARGPISPTSQTEQDALISQLLSKASGSTQFSAGQDLLTRGGDEATKRALALSAGVAPQNLGLANRLAADQGADIAQQTASDSAILAAQEQQAAQQQLGQAIGQTQQFQLQAQQQFQELQTFFESLGFDINQAASLANQEFQRLQVQARLQEYGIQEQAFTNKNALDVQSRGQDQKLIGGFFDAGSGVLGEIIRSDERLKKDISDPEESDFIEFLSSMIPKNFKYKNKSFGEGEITGIMAQDLEKSKIGKNMIEETEVGKGINIHKAVSAILASSSNMNKRLSALEGA